MNIKPYEINIKLINHKLVIKYRLTNAGTTITEMPVIPGKKLINTLINELIAYK